MNEALVMEHIEKTFGQGHTQVTSLKDINFEIKPGEMISIIGPSGSGKSTFLTIAGGLLQPTSGKLEINGKNFSDLTEKKRAAQRFEEIGFILQSSNLVPFLKVDEQFYLVDKVNKQRRKGEKMNALLESLDILSVKNKYPRNLSGGERQRVAIARALYNDPSLLLADEPTASLDTDHAYEVVKLLAREAHDKKKATIMVTHDVRMTKWSDQLYKMEDGKLQKS